MPDWLAILKAYVDTLELAIGAVEGGTDLHNKLTAARAAFLDAAISSRSTLTQAQILSDTTPFAGANVALIKTQTDKLGDATIGLANLKALIDAITAYVDTLETIVGTEGGVALANKLTAARAAFLDAAITSRAAAATALSNAVWTDAKAGYLTAAVALASVCTAARLGELDPANIPADIDTLLVRLPAVLSAARIGYLDNLIGTVTTGTFSLVNNTSEQDCVTFGAGYFIIDIELDMVNLAQINTVREYVEVDGATPRQISAKAFPTDFDTGTKSVIISFVQKNSNYKVTLQASVAEGGAKNVPYRFMKRKLS